MTVETRRLTEAAFKATFTHRMREVSQGAAHGLDIWPYVEAIPAGDLDGLDPGCNEVSQVWSDAYDRYHHVMLPLSRDHVCLVIVVDVRNRAIYGHHLLDLGASERP